MAITISGENNNDRILAQDGVIDQISGINIVGLITASHIDVGSNINLGNAGIVTATTFVGNLTGNVNSTSPLLLQTNGGERFRITGNNELGIAGANYGSSGQVLTSGGSGSSVTWSTISTDLINDSSPQLGGDLDVNGKKIKFPDLTGSVNNILYFGTHDDLLIYHHADVNYIQCENARTLRFQYWTGSGNETLANFIPNGAVQLYHNDTKRFETFDNNPFVGISVTNDVVLNGSGDTAYRWAVGGNAVGNFKWSMYYANVDGALRLFDNVNSRPVTVWKNNGTIELNYQAGKRFETTNEGATFSTGSSSCVVRLTSNNSSVHILQAFNNDLNIKAPSSGGISLFTDGSSERLRISSGGTVVIGDSASATPVGQLHLYRASNDPYMYIQRGSGDSVTTIGGIFWRNSGNNLGLVDVQSQDVNDAVMRFYTMGGGNLSERFRLRNNNTGGVALITSPASGDTLNLQTDAGGGQGMIFGTDTSNSHIYLKNNSSGHFGFQYKHGSTTQLEVKSNGAIQQYASGGENQFISKRTGSTYSNGDYYFYLFAKNNGDTNVGSMGIVRDTANDDSRIVFSTATGGTNTERLRITSTGNTRIGIPPTNGSSSLIDEKQATIGTKHFYTVYHNFSSTNSPLAVNSKIPHPACGTVEIMAGWANGNGMTYKKFYWASSGNTSGCTQLFSTGASRYGVSTSVGTPTMSISGDYTNFSFTFSDGQGAKMEKLKIHFEYFNQFRIDG